jgi:RNA polymerase sigma-70 factor (ECF subfamily)
MLEPIPVPSPDDDLMSQVAGDCTAALESLMELWQARIYRYILRGVRDAGVAEELTQETFWRLWRARRQYKPGGKFSARATGKKW